MSLGVSLFPLAPLLFSWWRPAKISPLTWKEVSPDCPSNESIPKTKANTRAWPTINWENVPHRPASLLMVRLLFFFLNLSIISASPECRALFPALGCESTGNCDPNCFVDSSGAECSPLCPWPRFLIRCHSSSCMCVSARQKPLRVVLYVAGAGPSLSMI